MAYPTSVATNADLYLAVNQLSGVLNGSIDAVVTTITLTSTTGFPAVGVVTIGSEVIKYTSTNATQLLGCTRGFDGTGATTHSSGATVKHAITAVHHNALKDELIALENALLNGPTGRIRYLQALQITTTTPLNTASATFVATSMTLPITTTTGRVKISYSGQLEAGTGSMAVTVTRNGTNLLSADGWGRYTSSVSGQLIPGSGVYIDSPGPGTFTYAIALRALAGSIQIGNQGTQVMILEEIV